MNALIEQASLAKKASQSIRNLSLQTRNTVLASFADNLIKAQQDILSANALDLQQAEENGMSQAMLDRLTLNEERIKAIAEGIRGIIALDDPLHQCLEERTLASGIHLKKITVPIGTIAIIFESRPNVSADSAALCFKAGNACILKGGKESYQSCQAIIQQMKQALKDAGISEDAVVLAKNPTHEETQTLMDDCEDVDLLIPRGGKNLIRTVVQHASVPVIETGAGVCHVYVDESADLDMAEKIILNAKCSRPSVCNAMETLLINEKTAPAFLPRIVQSLRKAGVRIHGDDSARSLIIDLAKADEQSWYTEYDDLEMNLKIVSSVEEACAHINHYGTHHSESIISETPDHVETFMNECDSACVYHNASTRFTDGFEFGLGAEIGISTQKLHARGPMGLTALTTYTYHLEGKGEIR